jgi:hypothetical protein
LIKNIILRRVVVVLAFLFITIFKLFPFGAVFQDLNSMKLLYKSIDFEEISFCLETIKTRGFKVFFATFEETGEFD